MNRTHYKAVAVGALLLTLPGSLRQEPTNPAAAVVKSPILVRAEEMTAPLRVHADPSAPASRAIERWPTCRSRTA